MSDPVSREISSPATADASVQSPGPPSRPRWRRLGRWALALGLIALFLSLAHRQVLVGYAHMFRVDDPVASDAIMVLIGGPDHRPARVAELYRQGVAPIILLGESGTMPVLELDQTALTRRFLIREGVPEGAVQVLPGGVVTSTYDEAVRMRDYARTHHVRRITIVTTAFHTARSRWIFRRQLRDLGVDIRMAAAAHPRFNESNWYRSEDGLVAYFEELVKMFYYWIAH